MSEIKFQISFFETNTRKERIKIPRSISFILDSPYGINDIEIKIDGHFLKKDYIYKNKTMIIPISVTVNYKLQYKFLLDNPIEYLSINHKDIKLVSLKGYKYKMLLIDTKILSPLLGENHGN
jgi:hypothetical protein